MTLVSGSPLFQMNAQTHLRNTNEVMLDRSSLDIMTDEGYKNNWIKAEVRPLHCPANIYQVDANQNTEHHSTYTSLGANTLHQSDASFHIEDQSNRPPECDVGGPLSSAPSTPLYGANSNAGSYAGRSPIRNAFG